MHRRVDNYLLVRNNSDLKESLERFQARSLIEVPETQLQLMTLISLNINDSASAQQVD